MYKKVLKILRESGLKKSEYFDSLYKSEDGLVLKKPHFIFSAENPLYPAKIKMSHDETMDFLANRGYKAEKVKGRYGNDETSIIVHNPPKHAIKHLMKLAHGLGQESSIYSDSYNHEMHYHHGDNAGKYHKGQGTAIHKRPPENFFSTLSDGTTFTHNFNLDEAHDRSQSMVKQTPESMKKSESSSRVYLAKKEDDHPLDSAGPETKLIHYSPHGGIETLNPIHHGERRIGAEAKQGTPEHPTTFFYLEGTKPESVVTQGSQHKYVASKGSMKFYDVGKDHEGMKTRAKELAEKENLDSKYPNPPGSAVSRREHLDQSIRQAGYHGIYNSSLNDTMRNVVAVYDKVPVDKTHPIHRNDYKEVSATNHHANDESLNRARDFAKENGHHSAKLLHGLMEDENG